VAFGVEEVHYALLAADQIVIELDRFVVLVAEYDVCIPRGAG
jgi:hypothetical protein